MINTKTFGNELKNLGFSLFSGVPCSYLKPLINYAINECDYVTATNEGDAVAIASGATVGGMKSVVLMQNSGLTNAISPLSSLNYVFKIPILGFVSLRGEEGIQDEPQHELMGKITTQLLDLLEIEWEYLSFDLETALAQIKRANALIEKKLSFFFVVKKNTFEIQELNNKPKEIQNSIKAPKIKQIQSVSPPTRYATLSIINSLKDSYTVQLATTGKTGRELYEIEDSRQNLYMVGSMGCVAPFGLGLAMSQKDKDIVVIDGDGSLLMRMGSLATIGYYKPSNLLHILLDNQVYDSTGKQSTVAESIDFVTIASSSGYHQSIYIKNLDELKYFIKHWKKHKKLTFLHLRIAPGSKKDLGRPKLKPHEVKERLQVFLND